MPSILGGRKYFWLKLAFLCADLQICEFRGWMDKVRFDFGNIFYRWIYIGRFTNLLRLVVVRGDNFQIELFLLRLMAHFRAFCSPKIIKLMHAIEALTRVLTFFRLFELNINLEMECHQKISK